MWNYEFELPDGFYSKEDIQDFEDIQKTWNFTH